MKILLLCLYPKNTAPSQRYRFEQFFLYFNDSNITFDIDYFYSQRTYDLLYRKGDFLRKAGLIACAYLSRFIKLNNFKNYDFIFIQREASPIGPPFFEYVLANIFKKKIIYDFDDAIWMPQDDKENTFFRWLKCYNKVGKICKWSHHVMVGISFLERYARQFTSHVSIVPTVVDTNKKYTIQKQNTSSLDIVVGWTGSHSTIRYLLSLKDVFIELDNDTDVRFLVIADKAPEELKLLKIDFIQWKDESEIEDLLKMDIGVMPLVDNDWTRGKCGFKAIQYMALGIPALVSPVGVNEVIVDDNINGFICRDEKDWRDRILMLKNNPDLRKKMGEAAKTKIRQNYSVDYAFPLIMSILQGI